MEISNSDPSMRVCRRAVGDEKVRVVARNDPQGARPSPVLMVYLLPTKLSGGQLQGFFFHYDNLSAVQRHVKYTSMPNELSSIASQRTTSPLNTLRSPSVPFPFQPWCLSVHIKISSDE